ncbi:MAG: hypothetical protein ACM3KM_01680 [Acidobacteriaceae bacterium]
MSKRASDRFLEKLRKLYSRPEAVFNGLRVASVTRDADSNNRITITLSNRTRLTGAIVEEGGSFQVVLDGGKRLDFPAEFGADIH